MNQNNKLIISKLLEKKHITTNNFSLFYRNEKNIFSVLKSQYNYKRSEIVLIRGNIYSWVRNSQIWKESEIIVFNLLLNNGFVMYLDDISNKSGYSKSTIINAILALEIDEKAIKSIIHKNKKIIFICMDYINKIEKNGNR